MSIVSVTPTYIPYNVYANAHKQYLDAGTQFQSGRSLWQGEQMGIFHTNSGLQELTYALENDLALLKRDNALIKARLNIIA